MDSAVLWAALAALACMAVRIAEACDGFKMEVTKIDTTCPKGEKSILTIKNGGATLTPDCKFIPRGCTKVSQKVETAIVSYKISTGKGMVLLQRTRDMCEALTVASNHSDFNLLLDTFEVPKSCPIKAHENCGGNKGKHYDVSKYKYMLIEGVIKVEVITKHEKGMMSCVNVEAVLKKS